MDKKTPYPKIKVKFKWLGDDKCAIRVMVNEYTEEVVAEMIDPIMFEASCAYVVASLMDKIANRMYKDVKIHKS